MADPRPDPAAQSAAAPAAAQGALALDMAQAALANVVCALAVQRIEDDNTALLLAVLDELLPQCHRNSPMIAALISAGEQISAAAARRREGGGGMTWAVAMNAASAAAFDFLFWRGAAALERHRKDKPDV